METLSDEMKYTSKTKYMVLAAAIGVNLISGFIYTWSILSKSLIEDFGWTSSQSSLPYTLFLMSFVIAMVIFGKTQDSKGPRFVATLGCIFMGSGLILSGLFTSPKVMVITIGIIAGGGVGMMTVATSPPVVKWFPPSKKGMVTSLVVAGAGLSSVYYSPLATYLIATVGLQKTFIFLGAGALVLSTIFAQGLTNPPRGYSNEEDKENLDNVKSNDFTWQEMLKDLDFYKVWLILAFSSSAGLMIMGHIASIANIQVKWDAGFILVIILAICNTIGRMSGGTISDKIGRMKLLKITFVVQAINMLVFIKYTSQISLVLGAAMAGLCYGMSFSVFPATISDLYGTKNFGINYGLMFTGWGVGGIIGPMIAATIYDSLNSYHIAYIVSLILLLISILLASRIKIVKE